MTDPLAIKEPESHNKAKDKLKLYVSSFQKYLVGDDKALHFTFIDFVLGILHCRTRKKDKLVSMANKRIEGDTDIVNIMKRVQDLDKLKQVLFNDAQNNVFSYSRPPLIAAREEPLLADVTSRRGSQRLSAGRKSVMSRLSLQANFGNLATRRKKTLLKNKDVAEYSNLNDFAVLFENYRKLRRTKDNKINAALIRLLDAEMLTTLYDLDFGMRVDEEFNEQYYKILGIKAFEQLFEKSKRERSSKRLTKEDAALIIARRLQIKFKNRLKASDLKKLRTLSKKDLDDNNDGEIERSDQVHRDRDALPHVSGVELRFDGDDQEDLHVPFAFLGNFSDHDTFTNRLESGSNNPLGGQTTDTPLLTTMGNEKLTYGTSPHLDLRPSFAPVGRGKSIVKEEDIWGSASRDSIE